MHDKILTQFFMHLCVGWANSWNWVYQIGRPADERPSDQILHFTSVEVTDSAHDQILDIQPTEAATHTFTSKDLQRKISAIIFGRGQLYFIISVDNETLIWQKT